MQTTERTINSDTRLTVRRLLPVNGEVLVQRGARVSPLDIVARAEIAHRYQVINVARLLAHPEVDMSEVMRKAEGDPVEANEAIAVASGGLPFILVAPLVVVAWIRRRRPWCRAGRGRPWAHGRAPRRRPRHRRRRNGRWRRRIRPAAPG